MQKGVCVYVCGLPAVVVGFILMLTPHGAGQQPRLGVLSSLAWKSCRQPMTSDLQFQSQRSHRFFSTLSRSTRTQGTGEVPASSLLAHRSYAMVLSYYPADLASTCRSLYLQSSLEEKEKSSMSVNISSRLPGTYSLSSVLGARQCVCRFNQLGQQLAGT